MSQPRTRPFANRRSWLLFVGFAIFLFAFFIGSVELLHYTESTAFCTLCHSMDPEKTAYQTSPHQNVNCGTCHIGPGVTAAIQAKIANIRYVWLYPTNLYERPIASPITSLRPVEVVCEQCHWPQKFYTDRLLEVNRFAEDETNTRTRTYLLLKTGGSAHRPGLARGIHWHIENQVRYRATDRRLQDIPWVEATINGTVTEYLASDTQLTREQIQALPVRIMDCIDCHNRATHIFRSPTDAVDQAMASGQLNPKLPYLKQKAVQLLEPLYSTTLEATDTISREIKAFYAAEYPEISPETVELAAHTLIAIYQQIKFPEMRTDGRTQSYNIWHKEFAGCFSFHDGQHFSDQKQSIRLECNICHSIPQVVVGDAPPPQVSLGKTVAEPASHQDSNWIALHRREFDASCSACHTTANAGGSDNSSFCANSACHGTAWEFAGLDAPAVLQLGGLSEAIKDQAVPMPHPVMGYENCVQCHGPGGVRVFPADHRFFGIETCVGCHRPPPEPTATLVAPTATPAAPSPAPGIPHTLEGRDDCLMCHDLGKLRPFPADHAGRSNATCQACHAALPTGAAPTTPPAAAAAGTAAAPGIPHTLEGRDDCLMCHDLGKLRPFPADHAGPSNATCQACHAALPTSATPTADYSNETWPEEE